MWIFVVYAQHTFEKDGLYCRQDLLHKPSHRRSYHRHHSNHFWMCLFRCLLPPLLLWSDCWTLYIGCWNLSAVCMAYLWFSSSHGPFHIDPHRSDFRCYCRRSYLYLAYWLEQTLCRWLWLWLWIWSWMVVLVDLLVYRLDCYLPLLHNLRLQLLRCIEIWSYPKGASLRSKRHWELKVKQENFYLQVYFGFSK